jgi:hypothetical protein
MVTMMRIVASFALLTVLAGLALAQPETPSPATPAVCDGKNLPMKLPDGSTGVPVECCRARDDVLVHEGRGAKNLAFRLVGKPCSMFDDPHKMCSIPGSVLCDYGACGAAHALVIEGTAQHVFKPAHAVKACGYQIKLQPSSAGVDQVDAYSEMYDSQVEYPKVTPACPYTACIGLRQPGISVSVTLAANNATGTVQSSPPGITLLRPGSATSLFADPVKLTANPGQHARAVFSGGGCTASGGYGATIHCNVPLAPDPEVTVTFECKADETCPMQ